MDNAVIEKLEKITQKNSSWLKLLFSHMPKRFLAQIELLQLPPERRFIIKGESNHYIYIVYEGMIRVINEFDNGRIFAFATTQIPAFSGLLELLSENEINTSTVETIQESKLIRIQKKAFSQWMNEDVEAYKLVVKIFARQLYPSLLSMGSYYVYPKFVVLLQFLVKTYEAAAAAAAGKEVIVTETREELSEILGFSLRTVYRLSNRLVEENLAEIRKKKIHLTSPKIEKMKNYIMRTSYEHQA